MDSNCGLLTSEATALPTEPLPLPLNLTLTCRHQTVWFQCPLVLWFTVCIVQMVIPPICENYPGCQVVLLVSGLPQAFWCPGSLVIWLMVHTLTVGGLFVDSMLFHGSMGYISVIQNIRKYGTSTRCPILHV